ncbi:trithorax group protein osa-like isoform X2 [Homarus americanus]|uniref:trithorax group protein osa-like isoform X2 n=1 Tax=Homarus americanus TaxID=6706 RepID=UPI001C47431F|nr:trithorax group protein osa-like isoform X2 [Homarus americanus]
MAGEKVFAAVYLLLQVLSVHANLKFGDRIRHDTARVKVGDADSFNRLLERGEGNRNENTEVPSSSGGDNYTNNILGSISPTGNSSTKDVNTDSRKFGLEVKGSVLPVPQLSESGSRPTDIFTRFERRQRKTRPTVQAARGNRRDLPPSLYRRNGTVTRKIGSNSSLDHHHSSDSQTKRFADSLRYTTITSLPPRTPTVRSRVNSDALTTDQHPVKDTATVTDNIQRNVFGSLKHHSDKNTHTRREQGRISHPLEATDDLPVKDHRRPEVQRQERKPIDNEHAAGTRKSNSENGRRQEGEGQQIHDTETDKSTARAVVEYKVPFRSESAIKQLNFKSDNTNNAQVTIGEDEQHKLSTFTSPKQIEAYTKDTKTTIQRGKPFVSVQLAPLLTPRPAVRDPGGEEGTNRVTGEKSNGPYKLEFDTSKFVTTVGPLATHRIENLPLNTTALLTDELTNREYKVYQPFTLPSAPTSESPLVNTAHDVPLPLANELKRSIKENKNKQHGRENFVVQQDGPRQDDHSQLHHYLQDRKFTRNAYENRLKDERIHQHIFESTQDIIEMSSPKDGRTRPTSGEGGGGGGDTAQEETHPSTESPPWTPSSDLIPGSSFSYITFTRLPETTQPIDAAQDIAVAPSAHQHRLLPFVTPHPSTNIPRKGADGGDGPQGARNSESDAEEDKTPLNREYLLDRGPPRFAGQNPTPVLQGRENLPDEGDNVYHAGSPQESGGDPTKARELGKGNVPGEKVGQFFNSFDRFLSEHGITDENFGKTRREESPPRGAPSGGHFGETVEDLRIIEQNKHKEIQRNNLPHRETQFKGHQDGSQIIQLQSNYRYQQKDQLSQGHSVHQSNQRQQHTQNPQQHNQLNQIPQTQHSPRGQSPPSAHNIQPFDERLPKNFRNPESSLNFHLSQPRGVPLNQGPPHDTLPNQSPPQGARSNQGPQHGARPNQGPPQGIQLNQGPLQGARPNQGQPQGIYPNQGPLQGAPLNQVSPQGARPNQGPPQDIHLNQGSLQGVDPNQGSPHGGRPNQGPLQSTHLNQGPLQGARPNQGQPQGIHPNQGQPQGIHPNQGPLQGAPLNQVSPQGARPNQGPPQGINLNQGSLQGVEPNQGSPHGVRSNQGSSQRSQIIQLLPLSVRLNQVVPQGLRFPQGQSQNSLLYKGPPQGVPSHQDLRLNQVPHSRGPEKDSPQEQAHPNKIPQDEPNLRQHSSSLSHQAGESLHKNHEEVSGHGKEDSRITNHRPLPPPLPAFDNERIHGDDFPFPPFLKSPLSLSQEIKTPSPSLESESYALSLKEEIPFFYDLKLPAPLHTTPKESTISPGQTVSQEGQLSKPSLTTPVIPPIPPPYDPPTEPSSVIVPPPTPTPDRFPSPPASTNILHTRERPGDNVIRDTRNLPEEFTKGSSAIIPNTNGRDPRRVSETVIEKRPFIDLNDFQGLIAYELQDKPRDLLPANERPNNLPVQQQRVDQHQSTTSQRQSSGPVLSSTTVPHQRPPPQPALPVVSPFPSNTSPQSPSLSVGGRTQGTQPLTPSGINQRSVPPSDIVINGTPLTFTKADVKHSHVQITTPSGKVTALPPGNRQHFNQGNVNNNLPAAFHNNRQRPTAQGNRGTQVNKDNRRPQGNQDIRRPTGNHDNRQPLRGEGNQRPIFLSPNRPPVTPLSPPSRFPVVQGNRRPPGAAEGQRIINHRPLPPRQPLRHPDDRLRPPPPRFGNQQNHDQRVTQPQDETDDASRQNLRHAETRENENIIEHTSSGGSFSGNHQSQSGTTPHNFQQFNLLPNTHPPHHSGPIFNDGRPPSLPPPPPQLRPLPHRPPPSTPTRPHPFGNSHPPRPPHQRHPQFLPHERKPNNFQLQPTQIQQPRPSLPRLPRGNLHPRPHQDAIDFIQLPHITTSLGPPHGGTNKPSFKSSPYQENFVEPPRSPSARGVRFPSGNEIEKDFRPMHEVSQPLPVPSSLEEPQVSESHAKLMRNMRFGVNGEPLDVWIPITTKGGGGSESSGSTFRGHPGLHDAQHDAHTNEDYNDYDDNDNNVDFQRFQSKQLDTAEFNLPLDEVVEETRLIEQNAPQHPTPNPATVPHSQVPSPNHITITRLQPTSLNPTTAPHSQDAPPTPTLRHTSAPNLHKGPRFSIIDFPGTDTVSSAHS